MPRLKPPFFPAAIGLYGQPTIVNNVETLSNLPWIAAQRRRRRTPRSAPPTSPGTRMVAVSGHVKRPGVFEIVNGTTTFRDLIYGDEFCQGIRDGNELKAFVPGGGSAPWFIPDQLDLPFEGQARRRRRIDARLGRGHGDGRHHRHPGGRADAVRFYAHESCGKCVPVPRGRHVAGRGSCSASSTAHGTERRPRPAARGRRVDLPGRRSRTRRASGSASTAVPFPYKMTTICFVGPSAYVPVHSALTLFPEEFAARVRIVPIAQAHPRRRSEPAVRAEVHATSTDRRPRSRPTSRTRPSRRCASADTEPLDPNVVTITINGRAFEARKGELVIAAAERAGEYIPRFCYHARMTSVGMCRHVPGRVDTGRGPAVAAVVHDRRSPPDMKVDTESPTTQAGAGGHARAAARQPPARLPGVRQGRRVPAAGPGVQPRSRRESLRRGEAPLREADPDQRPGAPRPRALHPVRPLHALRRRGRRRRADPLHQPRQRHPGDDVPRRAVRLVLLAATPCRSARSARSPPSPTGSRPARGTSPSPRARAPPARSAAASSCSRAATSCVRYQGVDSDPVNWGWLCDRGRFDFEAVNCDRSASPPRSCDGEPDVVERGARRRCRRHPHDARRRRVPAAIALLGGARGTNEDAFAWARLADVIGIASRRPARRRPAGGGRSTCRGPRSTRRPPPRRSCCSDPISRRSCRSSTCACAHAAEKRVSRIIEFDADGHRTQLVCVAQRARTRPAAAAAVTAALVERGRRASSSPSGPVVIVAGRANLAESAAAAAARCALPTTRSRPCSPTPRCSPALRRGNVVGALAARPAPAPGRPGRHRHPAGRRRRRDRRASCCSAPIR